MIVLGIETSCDETSVAIIEGKNKKVKVLSNIVSSQIDLHARYGGVVPEVAARAHIENIIPALKAALSKAKMSLDKIDLIAVTCGPGLIGSLLIGVNTAKTIAFEKNIPIVPINHIEGHIYANFVSVNPKFKTLKSTDLTGGFNSEPKFPLLNLVVSGGHTSLILMQNHGKYKIIGQTLDDAAGEAFDKVGSILNLPYPGGPQISKIAKFGKKDKFTFPRAWMGNNFNFSFSGLKTAVLYQTKSIKKITPQIKADIAASFQEAAIEVLVTKAINAARKYCVSSIAIGGGVASNPALRQRLKKECQKIKKEFYAPDKILCTDNAAMIATTGYFHALHKDTKPWQKINVDLGIKL